jgi:hypothetical protein
VNQTKPTRERGDASRLQRKDIMSTGFDHSDKHHFTFDEIDSKVQEFDISAFMGEGVVKQETSPAQRLAAVYPAARLIVAAIASTPLLPTTWRSVLSLLLVVLDQVTNFKAGKDLAAGDGDASASMEPKLPA